jgi:nitrile hydratase
MAIQTRTEESFTPAMRTEALEDILTERGLVDPKVLAGLIKNFEENVGPMNGARVVARAWVDPEFRARLLDDATAACAELGYKGAQGECIVALENSPTVHNLVVCTLCSCYPWPLLGLPPGWYKDPAYRARAVREPRKVLGEFGLQLGNGVEVRVWDSTAEVRYLVLPERPAGTQGLAEEDLAGLVTREAMVGIAKVTGPAA